MKLTDLLEFDNITVQCHDNPDADAIGSGYALYKYFENNGKTVRLVYSGKNILQKSNLKLLVDTLKIPVQYLEKFAPDDEKWHKGLWLTVDCQYGAGNVTKFDADNVVQLLFTVFLKKWVMRLMMKTALVQPFTTDFSQIQTSSPNCLIPLIVICPIRYLTMQAS